MSISNCIAEYIDGIEPGIPIWTSDIYEYVIRFFSDVKRPVVNASIARFAKSHPDFVRYQKGIYYKTRYTSFGEAGINMAVLIRRLYLVDRNMVIGYETGPSYMNKIGLTTQMPAHLYIATERTRYTLASEDGRLVLIKPKVAITKENFRYLQFLDIIENRIGINLETSDYARIMGQFIIKHNLGFEQIIYFTRFYHNNQMYDKIAMLAKNMHELSEDEKIDIVAKCIFEKHRRAFKDLAK